MLSTIIIMAILCSVHNCIFSFQNITLFHLSFVFHQTRAKFLNFLKLLCLGMYLSKSLKTVYTVHKPLEAVAPNSLPLSNPVTSLFFRDAHGSSKIMTSEVMKVSNDLVSVYDQS